MLLELKQKLAALIAEHKKIFTTADAESRALTDEEKALDDDLAAQIADLQSQVDRAERQQQIERDAAAQQFDNLEDAQVVSDPAGTFENLGEFAMAVHASSGQGAQMDARLQAMYNAAPSNFHQESGTTEGFMVPAQFRDQIWELVFEEEGLINLVDLEPTSGNAVRVIKDESTPWGSTGVQANWRVEGTQMNASKLSTKSTNLDLNQIFAFVLATEELLEDAPRLNDRLTRKSAQAINYKVDEAIVDGDGTGKPLGWLKSNALVSVAKEGSQLADTVVTGNVAKMFSRMLPSGIGRAVWLINSDVLPQIMTMVIGDRPIWTPPNGFIDSPAGLLLGRPLRLSEHAKTVGDKGDIQFVDPLGYYAARKAAGVQFAQSMHLFFDYNMQAFRWIFRIAGQPYLSAPVTPPNSALTKSHFVTLDERA